jgi:ABC-2 type transport system permease protein
MVGLGGAALGGAWWPLEIVPEFMQIIGHISPVAWAMDGFHEIMFFKGGLTDIVVPLAVLMIIGGVSFVIGVQRFSIE